MTKKQITWASQHDWFIRADDCGNGVWVKDYWFDMNHKANMVEEFFDDFNKLVSWAGY